MNKEGGMNQVYKLSISATINEISESLEKNLPYARSRLDNFIIAFENEFPKGQDKESMKQRGAAEALTWALMGGPLTLYALNMNGPAIVDLHGVLERFVIREVSKHLSSSKEGAIVLSRIIERRTLPDLAQILLDLQIWDKEDVKFTKRLNTLRNGAAHKNPKTISNVVCSGRKISMLDVDSVMTDVDYIPLIISTIHLLMKMFQFQNEKAELSNDA